MTGGAFYLAVNPSIAGACPRARKTRLRVPLFRRDPDDEPSGTVLMHQRIRRGVQPGYTLLRPGDCLGIWIRRQAVDWPPCHEASSGRGWMFQTRYATSVARLHGRASRWLGMRVPTAFGRFSRPDSVAILLTERCSARCVHCDIWRNRGLEKGPQVADWVRLLDELREWLGPVHVVLTGGEALLKPFTVDLVRHASSIGLRVEVLSHGYWRDQKLIESLALAKPWRVTVSLDGLGRYHDVTRGREGFFDRTVASLQTLARVGEQHGLDLRIRLKTVIMRQNLPSLSEVARYATTLRADVLYQPIEQNYNTAEAANWFETSDNWPDDIPATINAIQELVKLKESGLPIANSRLDFERMIAYFQDPGRYRVRIQSHDFSARCAALTNLQVQANGDVKACVWSMALGNICDSPIQDLWSRRPASWNDGCCLPGRMSVSESADVELIK